VGGVLGCYGLGLIDDDVGFIMELEQLLFVQLMLGLL